jgi:hypothetical protein
VKQYELGVRIARQAYGRSQRLLRSGREVDRAEDLVEAHVGSCCNCVASGAAPATAQPLRDPHPIRTSAIAGVNGAEASDMTKRYSTWAPFAIAALVGVAAILGIAAPAIYARETASWAAQGIGQDWVDLVVCAPALVISGLFAMHGSRRGRLVVGGLLIYVAYAFAIYAFAMHFNALFLVYCAAFGASCFALVQLVKEMYADAPRSWFGKRAPIRIAASTLFAIAGVFGALWLGQIVPAIVHGDDPPGLAEVGLVVNPVHVLDLAVLLPAMVVAGVLMLRRDALGIVVGPMLLVFGVMMAIAIGGMIAMMNVRGIAFDLAPALVMTALASAGLVVVVALLRRIHRPSFLRLVLVTLALGCHHEPAPRPAVVDNVAGDLRAARQQMHARFDAATELQTWIVRGDLSRVRTYARVLDALDEPAALAEWRPYVIAVRNAARQVVIAPDLVSAARATGAVGLACATCHVAMDAHLTFSPLQPPSEHGMQEHAWAAQQMWRGLIGPDDAHWISGAGALSTMPFDLLARVMTPHYSGDRDDVVRVRELADVARGVGLQGARGDVYGHLLAACTHCHAVLRDR